MYAGEYPAAFANHFNYIDLDRTRLCTCLLQNTISLNRVATNHYASFQNRQIAEVP